MEKLICNAPWGKAKSSSFARVVALALAGAVGTAFADTAINLANSLSTVEGVYTVEGTVTLTPASGAAIDLNGHRADVAFTGDSKLTGANSYAGLQVNEGSTLTLSGYGDTQKITLHAFICALSASSSFS